MAPDTGVQILIIDDDAAILHALEMFLKQEGYSVTAMTAYRGYLDKLKAEKRPDLIILDILLSEESGYKIAKQLKRNRTTRDIPIVMISAHPGGETMTEQAGAEAFLAKPFDMDSLLGTIETLAPAKA